MSPSYRDRLLASGAVFDEAAGVEHYGDPAGELQAALEGCVVADRSDLARLRATGRDVLDLVNRLSTNDVKTLAVGEGRATVLTSPKGRIVERLYVHRVADRNVVLVAGARRAEAVLAHLKKYTFAEDTGLIDITGSTRQIVVTGLPTRQALEAAGLPAPPSLGTTIANFGEVACEILGQDGLTTDGASVVVAEAGAAEVWTRLSEAVGRTGGRPAGAIALEARRILRGCPASGAEMTEECNPLEVGLRYAVSFTKGCYVGQEVVARLNTYDRVSRALAGFVLEPEARVPARGASVVYGGRTIGFVTSGVRPPGRRSPVALAIVKHRDLPEDAAVLLGEGDTALPARRSPLPFRPTP